MTVPEIVTATRGSGVIRRALVLAGIGALAAAALLTVVGVPRAQAQACSDVEVVFARGTGEPVGVGRVGQAFVDALSRAIGGRSISVYPVNYPASYDFLQATAGAADAQAHIQSTVAACPGTEIVLGGYSQGAAVVDLLTAAPGSLFGFAQPLPEPAAGHIAAVAVFGNPANRLGQPLPALSPVFGTRSIDLCNGADPVCSPGDDRNAHSRYVETGMTDQAAGFVAGKLAEPNAAGSAKVTDLAQ